MAHFAKVSEEGIVEQVIVADNKEWCESNLGGTWVQTSYNTYAGEHKLGGIPLHKNYAGISYHFDGTGFYAPQPFCSWIFNTETYLWNPPVKYPNDGNLYVWNEEIVNWEIVTAD